MNNDHCNIAIIEILPPYICFCTSFLFLAQLLFAVTHFDVYYTPGTGENNPDEKKVKQLVSEAFNDVKEDEVFPVCGKWVLNAEEMTL